MTEEDIRKREAAAKREYPETKAAFAKVASNALQTIVASKPHEVEKREECYRLIHLLAEVEGQLIAAMGQGSTEAIDAYIASLNAKPATTGNR